MLLTLFPTINRQTRSALAKLWGRIKINTGNTAINPQHRFIRITTEAHRIFMAQALAKGINLADCIGGERKTVLAECGLRYLPTPNRRNENLGTIVTKAQANTIIQKNAKPQTQADIRAHGKRELPDAHDLTDEIAFAERSGHWIAFSTKTGEDVVF